MLKRKLTRLSEASACLRRNMEDRVWSLGLGPMCCLLHHCPMTIYGGCPKCNKQILKDMGD